MEDKRAMSRKLSIRAIMSGVLLFVLSGVCLAGTSGVVVDAKTGKPVEGAVVVMEWTMTKGLGNTYHETYQVYERVTDKDGKFSVPGVLNPLVDAPTMAVYKRGYVCWSNGYTFDGKMEKDEKPIGSDMNIRLETWREGWSHYAHMRFFQTTVYLGHTELFREVVDQEEREGLNELEQKKALEKSTHGK